MADYFKNGILYMDSLNDSDIFNDIIKEQEQKEKEKKEKEEQKSREELIEEKAKEIEMKTKEAFQEIENKMKSNPDVILFDEDGVIFASNGYGLKIVDDGVKTEIKVIIKE